VTKYFAHQQGIFYHVTKSESMWHENICKIFDNVAWNMLQKFFVVHLNPFTHSSFATCFSFVNIVGKFLPYGILDVFQQTTMLK
jgi:hypothetical protein